MHNDSLSNIRAWVFNYITVYEDVITYQYHNRSPSLDDRCSPFY